MPSWLFSSLRGYDRRWIRGDVLAGLTVWAVLVPEALAYASIAGVSPVVGLYAAPGALLLYAGVRQLATPGHRADVGHRGAVGGDGRRDRRPPGQQPASLTMTGGAGDRHRHPGRCRGGLAAARFPGELHLRAGAEGLHRRAGADDHRRAGADAVRRREGVGDFFEQLWDVVTELGDCAGGARSWSGWARWPLLVALRRFAPAVPASLVVVAIGVVAVAPCSTWSDHGVKDRRSHRPGTAVVRCSVHVSFHDYRNLLRVRSG